MHGNHGDIIEVTLDHLKEIQSRYTMDAPSMRLRWRGGVLQQAAEITEYSHGQSIAQRIEWRDVPNAEGE